MYCGAAFAGSRGETPSLPFLCRRFFSQTEKKCRNAGSIYRLIIVGREGSESTIYKQIKIVVPAIADNGQPQGLSLLTVGNKHFENFMPLARQRCVEVAAPYKLHVNKFVLNLRTDDIHTTRLCRFAIFRRLQNRPINHRSV